MKLRKKEKTLTMAAAKAGMARNTARKYLTRMFHQFENEGDLARPERFSESFDVDQVSVE